VFFSYILSLKYAKIRLYKTLSKRHYQFLRLLLFANQAASKINPVVRFLGAAGVFVGFEVAVEG
jgi:hypothetical protein